MPRISISVAFVVASFSLAATTVSAQNLLVAVRQQFGEPLSEEAIVRVFSQANAQIDMATTGNGRTAAGTASFGVKPGDYEIQVEAEGYKNGVEHATITPSGQTSIVYVFLTPVGSSSAPAAGSGAATTQDIQRELNKSLAALRQNKFAEARKHLEKARKIAPSNPDVLYLMVMLSYSEKNFAAARVAVDLLLATYPTHERGLILLGQMQLNSSENNDAKTTLQRAVTADSNNWQAHYLLALVLVRTGELPKAELEAARARDLNKEKAAAMKILCAKILLLEGRDSEAKRVFQSTVREYPGDASVAEAKNLLDKIAGKLRRIANPQP